MSCLCKEAADPGDGVNKTQRSAIGDTRGQAYAMHVGAATATARTTTVLFTVITLPFLDFRVRSSTLAVGRHARVFLNFFFTTRTTLSGIHTSDSCI